jgi:signal transduction histidine kinase
LSLERNARARTEQLVEQLQAMESITEAALAHLDLDDMLSALLDRMSEALHVDTVAVLLLTDDGKWLVPRAAKGIEEEVEAGIRLPLGRGFARRIAAAGRPIVLDDVDHAEVLNPILRQKGIRSLLGVPLIVEGRTLGVLHVGTLYVRRFTEEDMRFLNIAADRVALAIDHARLYAAAERARLAAEAAAQEVRLRDEFLSVAAHELRTPVTGLRTAAQVILRQVVRGGEISPERLTRMASVIDQESDKLGRLVSQLLDLSRLEGGKLALERSEVDVVALARAVVERVQAHAPRSNIRVQGEESLRGWLDPLRIEQLLINLLDNAIKYSPEGGEILVECTNPTAETVQIAVRDHGIGLAAADHERIFERLYRVDESERTTGLGLGLYISREIVERHGGRIWAESPPDGGTRFVVTLPVGSPPEDTGGLRER